MSVGTVDIDFGDVTVEVEKAEMSNDQMKTVQEPELLLREQTEAPVASGFMQGMFSCACAPCEPASGDRVLVSPRAPPTLPNSQVPFVDSENAATTAKLDALTARIASMEQEMAFLRATNERLKELQSAEVNEV